MTALSALPGIGGWTAQYVALRALNEPTRFLLSTWFSEAELRTAGHRFQRGHWKKWPRRRGHGVRSGSQVVRFFASGLHDKGMKRSFASPQHPLAMISVRNYAPTSELSKVGRRWACASDPSPSSVRSDRCRLRLSAEAADGKQSQIVQERCGVGKGAQVVEAGGD